MAKTTADEVEELRDLIRQMHEALKDGTRLLKAMETVKEELVSVSQEVFEERIEGVVKEALDGFNVTMIKHIDDATEAVYNRFDVLGRVLLGKGKKSDIELLTHNAHQSGNLPIIQRADRG